MQRFAPAEARPSRPLRRRCQLCRESGRYLDGVTGNCLQCPAVSGTIALAVGFSVAVALLLCWYLVALNRNARLLGGNRAASALSILLCRTNSVFFRRVIALLAFL